MRYTVEQIVDMKCRAAEIKRLKEQEDAKEAASKKFAEAANKSAQPAKTPANKAPVQIFKIRKM